MQAKPSVAIKRFLGMVVIAFLLVANVLLISLMTMVTVSQAASPGDIVINEIMKDPSKVDDAYGEWFELYNTTGSDIDIDGWIIRDDGSDSHTIDSANGPTTVPAGGYLVLARNSDSGLNGGISGAYDYPGFYLVNDGTDEVVLVEGATEIDRVNYNDTTFPDTPGQSMELKNPAYDNNDGSNWAGATSTYGDGDYGTPGAQNSEYEPTSITLSSLTAHSTPPQPTFFRWQWLVLAGGLVFGGVAVARRWLGR